MNTQYGHHNFTVQKNLNNAKIFSILTNYFPQLLFILLYLNTV